MTLSSPLSACPNCKYGCYFTNSGPCQCKCHDLQPPAEDSNGHKISDDGKLIHDERCHNCDAPKLQTSEIEKLLLRIEDNLLADDTYPAERHQVRQLVSHIRSLEKERDKYYVQAEVAKEQATGFLGEMKNLEEKLSVAVEGLEEITKKHCMEGVERCNCERCVIAQKALAQIQLLTPKA